MMGVAVLYALAYTYGFLIGYYAVCGLYVGWRKFPRWLKVGMAPFVIVVVLADVTFNVTIGCVLFLGLPPRKCFTFTQRISFYKNETPDTWRGKFGRFICANLLDPAQVGGHCR